MSSPTLTSKQPFLGFSGFTVTLTPSLALAITSFSSFAARDLNAPHDLHASIRTTTPPSVASLALIDFEAAAFVLVFALEAPPAFLLATPADLAASLALASNAITIQDFVGVVGVVFTKCVHTCVVSVCTALYTVLVYCVYFERLSVCVCVCYLPVQYYITYTSSVRERERER